MRGKFITFEGIDGSGKSTQIELLKPILDARGIEFIITKEPGGTDIGNMIRQILLDGGNLQPETEILLMFASRKEHLHNVIIPALEQGKLVLCDRFTDSTYAYQTFKCDTYISKVRMLENWISRAIKPDLTLFFDISVNTAINRIKNDRSLDQFENEKIIFLEKIIEGYLRQIREEPDRFVSINSEQSKLLISHMVSKSVLKIL